MPAEADPSDLDPAILNDGVHLAMEWGEHWLRPIHDRLARAHPELAHVEVERYDEVCRGVMQRGHTATADALHAMWAERAWHGLDDIETDDIHARFSAVMRELAPWMSDDNLGRLFSQGMYYALK